jgi:hypothetical protein
MKPLSRLLRDPLLSFLVLGAAVFAASSLLDRSVPDTPGRIVVTKERIAQLVADFTRFHRRPPSADEQQGLIHDYLREEASYREAVALGLDRDDPIIRHRLRQKVEFVFDDVAALAEPTEAQLAAHLERHPDAFRIDPHVTFEQVYLDPRRRAADLARVASDLLGQLNHGTADAATAGDSFLLDHRFAAMPSSEVAKLFGADFASTLQQLPLGRWQGPVQSGYGPHLVLVRERTAGGVPALSEVRDAVRREWRNAERQTTKDRLYAGLLARYSVTVEQSNSEHAAAIVPHPDLRSR